MGDFPAPILSNPLTKHTPMVIFVADLYVVTLTA